MTRQPRSPRDLKRPPPKREPYDRVLIVCEGSKTEPTYFTELKNSYGLSSANIAITPASGSDPLSVVNFAKQEQQKERKQGDKYDRVYCVFDRDQHTNFDAAGIAIKGAADLYSARSWPCFEYWLLLHYGYQRAPFHPSANKTAAQICLSRLKEQLPNYDKGMQGIFATLSTKLDEALQYAARVQNDASATGEPNPSTEVHQLVSYLRGLK